RARNLFHRRRLLGWITLDPIRSLLAFDHRIDNQERNVDVSLAQLGGDRLRQRTSGERRRGPRAALGHPTTRRAAGQLDERAVPLFDERTRSRSEEHTSELQSPDHLVCRLLLEK